MTQHNRTIRRGFGHAAAPFKLKDARGQIRRSAIKIMRKIKQENKATSDMPDGWADIEKKRGRIDMIAAAHQRSLKTI